MKIMPNILFLEVERLILEGSSVRLNVDGNSMLPFIQGGRDVVELAPLGNPSELRRGAIVLFRYGHKYIIHRIISCSGDTLVIRGDGNSLQCETVELSDVIAVLRYVRYPSGRVVDCRNSWWWRVGGEIWMRMSPIRPSMLAFYRIFTSLAYK